MSNEHNNAPAVPQGEPVAWLDLSKMSASAMVYATGWKSNDKQSPLYTAAAPAPAQEPDDKAMLEVIDERDRCHEWADQLADAIAKHTGYEIGEHTSGNNPWRMALNALVCHEAKQEVGLTDAAGLSMLIAGALFDFGGYLTTHPDVIDVGSTALAGPVADRIKAFAAMRGLSLDDAAVLSWSEGIATLRAKGAV